MTNKAAVLGKPIAHSLSPAMHNAAYRELGYSDWEYGRAEVGEDDLEGFLDSLDPQWQGLSLTMPLKKTIMEYGVPCDDMVETLGVANTAVLQWVDLGDGPDAFAVDDAEDGAELGLEIELYNTDVFGIVQAFRESDPGIGERIGSHRGRVAVLGSGSTAMSALAALAQLGATDAVVGARHPDKVAALEPLADRLGLTLQAAALDSDGFVDSLTAVGAAVSALPAHAADAVAARIAACPGSRESIDATLLDVTYDPSPTDLMRAWSDRIGPVRPGGPAVIGGEEMLLWQGVRQVELMTGTPRHAVPVAAMRAALLEGLGR